MRKSRTATFLPPTLSLLRSLAFMLSLAPIVTGGGVMAQEAPPKEGIPIDGAALHNFFDANLPGEMERRHAPGAIAVIVKDGQIVFEKGYGVSDLEKGTAVDPDK